MSGPLFRKSLALLLCAGVLATSGCALLKRNQSTDEPVNAGEVISSDASGGAKVAPRPRLTVGDTKATASSKSPTEGPGEVEAKSGAVYRLKPGDPVVIFLRGIMPRDEQYEDIIDEGGYVNLPYIETIRAAGKTTSQLEKEIQKTYLDERIYKSVTVNVVMPSQSYFVRGEVRNPGRFALITGVTLIQAIATAGGYSEFADPTKVKVVRGEKSTQHNARDYEKNPDRDISIDPGDVIVVPRSIF